MKFARVAKLFVLYGIWRTTTIRLAGRGIVNALSSRDETVRTVAGMLLVRAGRLAEPLLRGALERRENLPLVLVILGDIGDKRIEPEIRSFSSDHDPDVAQAARDALRTITAR
jgi:hypothetical protein